MSHSEKSRTFRSCVASLATEHEPFPPGVVVVRIARRPTKPSLLSGLGFGRVAAIKRSTSAERKSSTAKRRRRTLAERVADEPFQYGEKCFPGRYSRGFPALYTSTDFATALAEKKHYVSINKVVTKTASPKLIIMKGAFNGSVRRLTEVKCDVCWAEMLNEDHSVCQVVGSYCALDLELDGIVVPSARHRARTGYGVNLPVFARDSVVAEQVSGFIKFYKDKRGRLRYRRFKTG